jgi:hypothetical protein
MTTSTSTKLFSKKSKYETNFINNVHNKKCLMHLYVPTKLKMAKRIVAIGDLHGDFDLAIKSLQIARVISVENKKIKWIGGNTIVVQTGDQLDSARGKNECNKCNDADAKTHSNKKKSCDIHVFKLFTKLHFAAMKHGGQVISLLGNHEVQNVLGLMDSYVSQNDIEYFITIENRNPSNPLAKRLLLTENFRLAIASVWIPLLKKIKYAENAIINMIVTTFIPANQNSNSPKSPA